MPLTGFYQAVLICLQLVGHYDEVLDVRFWDRDDSQVVVATNSSLLKIFDRNTWACRTVSGHNDCIVAIDTYQKGSTCLLASGAKVYLKHTVQLQQYEHVVKEI